jgi:hypothetical protein
MKSSALGKNISHVEVQDISRHGIWLYAKGREYHLPFKEYPWFKDAKLAEIQNVELLHDSHLHWPALDVDLELYSLQNPEDYPLIYQ